MLRIFERMRARGPVRDEASDSGDPHQDALIAQLACRARFAVMRDTPKDFTISFSDGTRIAAPHFARADIVQDVPLHFEIQGLKRCVGPRTSSM